MRKSWTDERLDDFREETARRFEEVRTETSRRFDEVDRRFEEVARRFEEVDRRFDRVDADMRELRRETKSGLERIDGRIDDMNRTILRLGSGALFTFVLGFAGLIATGL